MDVDYGQNLQPVDFGKLVFDGARRGANLEEEKNESETDSTKG